MIVQTVVEDDNLAQLDGQFIDQIVQDDGEFGVPEQVVDLRGRQRRIRGQVLLWRAVGQGYLLPDVASDGGPGIGGEGCATLGIEVLDGVPKTDAAGLKQLSVAEGAAILVADDGVNEAIVLGHRWPATCRGMRRVGA